MHKLTACVWALLAVTVRADEYRIAFQYYYERQPSGTTGYYEDKQRAALNDGARPSYIELANSVSVSRADNLRPVLVLTRPSVVEKVTLSWVTKWAWAKFPVKSFTVEGSRDGRTYFPPQTVLTNQPLVVEDDTYSHTFMLPVTMHCVRYVRLSMVEAVAQNACLTEITLEGTPCTGNTQRHADRHVPTVVSKRGEGFADRGIDAIIRR